MQSNFLPHKSFPEKSPVNGTSDQHSKTATSTGVPPASSYNRYVPKPYTTSARPFERKFDSPKFNHNLLPNDKIEIPPKVLNFLVPVSLKAEKVYSVITIDDDDNGKASILCLKQVQSTSPIKPAISPQPQNADHDSGLDTFTRTMDHRPKYQQNNINAVPKAIPVRYKASIIPHLLQLLIHIESCRSYLYLFVCESKALCLTAPVP